MNLAHAFVTSASRCASQPAVFWGETTFLYRDLHAATLRVAQLLRQRHRVQPGDRVAIWLKNCPEFIPILFGILETGAVAVPINNFLKPHEVEFILQDSGARILATDPALGESLDELRRLVPHIVILPLTDAALQPQSHPPSPHSPSPSPIQPADLAVLIYTSGTTGHPKGAMLSHGNLLHNVESCRKVLQAVDHDRFVLLLPMFHSFMLTACILLPLTVGGSIVLIRSLHPPRNILQEIIAHGGTILPAIPQFFRTLAHTPLPQGIPLRLCVSGAAPLPAEILREFNHRLPIPLLEGYGLSEASPVVAINPILGPWKAGSIGKPIPDVELTIQDDSGRILPPGESGELCVRGGNVMQGYWNQPNETTRALRNGWLLTGDIGHADSDGYFYISDRKKDMLLVNGINVYPREIEEVLYQFPGVKEAAVIGLPDPRKGELPLAFVAPVEGATLDEKTLHQHLRERLADYKLPRHIQFVTALPRNATGKVLKTTLRTLATSPSA